MNNKDLKLFFALSLGNLIAVFALLALFALPANASECFAEAGQARHERPDGTLWQAQQFGYETHWDTKPAMFRAGCEKSGFRVSYADLGNASWTGLAPDDEDGAIASGGMVGGDHDWYSVETSMRALLLTYRVEAFKYFTAEAGVGRYRQHFQVKKDDGWSWVETRYGLGYMVGIGVKINKTVSIVYERYSANIRFSEATGTGGADVLGLTFTL